MAGVSWFTTPIKPTQDDNGDNAYGSIILDIDSGDPTKPLLAPGIYLSSNAITQSPNCYLVRDRGFYNIGRCNGGLGGLSI